LLACEYDRIVIARELLQYTRELATIPLPNVAAYDGSTCLQVRPI